MAGSYDQMKSVLSIVREWGFYRQRRLWCLQPAFSGTVLAIRENGYPTSPYAAVYGVFWRCAIMRGDAISGQIGGQIRFCPFTRGVRVHTGSWRDPLLGEESAETRVPIHGVRVLASPGGEAVRHV